MKPVGTKNGEQPVDHLVASGVAVVVTDEDGTAVVGLTSGTDGEVVRAEVQSDGTLKPVAVNDGDAPVKVLQPTASKVTKVVPKLTAVIGSDGKPVPAIVGPDGRPIEAQVNAEGLVEPVRNAEGTFNVICGLQGEEAKLVVQESAPEIIAGENGDAVVAVRTSDGDLVRAELDDTGRLVPALGPDGWPESAEGKHSAKPLEVAETEAEVAVEVKPATDPQLVVVVNENGEAVPAMINADGVRIRARVNADGRLEPMLDEDGTPISITVKSEMEVSKLVTIGEDDEGDDSYNGRPASPMVSPRGRRTVGDNKELMARLAQLQGHMVSNEKGDMRPEEKENLKEALNKKKSRAERKRLEMQKVLASADDDGLLESIYSKATNALDIERAKLNKAKELLRAAREEAKDLQQEFEREREDMLAEIRQQTQELKYEQQLRDVIHPTLRRDCNYYNLDKIRKLAEWDDDKGIWLMPKLMVGSGNPRQEPLAPMPGVAPPRSMPPLDTRDDDKLRER